MNNLYFIAIIPGDEVCKEATALKNFMAETYFSKAALSSPPHITLYPPFRKDSSVEKLLDNSLTAFVQDKQKFEFSLNGFGCFKPSVIFIKPEPSESLNILQSKLLSHLKSTINLEDAQNNRPFHPQMTISTRDLKKNFFHSAWDEFREKEFKRLFEVRSIYLLKHNGKFWEILKEYSLQGIN